MVYRNVLTLKRENQYARLHIGTYNMCERDIERL